MQSVVNMVTQLENQDYEFNIFSSNKDLDGGILKNIIPGKWTRYNNSTDVWYSADNNFRPVLNGLVKVQKTGLLFINGIYSWHFTIKPLLFTRHLKKIVSVRGMLHTGALSQKAAKKKVYLWLWKFTGLHKKVTFHATDEDEKGHIQRVFGNTVKVMIAPNFSRAILQQPVIEKKANNLKLISIALISPMKNILMVLDSLMETVPENKIEYNIYGPVKDSPYWMMCKKKIEQLPSNISVAYHGDISPDEIVNVLAQNHVFVLPSKSENFGHAIFEALSAGRPVITSNNTPWHNLEKNNAGKNVDLDNFTELIQAINFFTGQAAEEFQLWSNGAAQYAALAMDITKIKEQYKLLFKSA